MKKQISKNQKIQKPLEVLIVDLPAQTKTIKGCWSQGYPVHQGFTKASLNCATVYSQQKKIVPNQKILQRDFTNFAKTLQRAGFRPHILPFPEKLNQAKEPHHDGVFIRDSGFMFQNYWVKAHFSATERQLEAEVFAPLIAKKFHKEILELPPQAYLEFGEVFYLETPKGSFYFGGLARSNRAGHAFLRQLLQPDYYCLIQSNGYHLDTVFCPIINPDSQLVACLVAKGMVAPSSLLKLKKLEEELGIEIIYLDPLDSSGRKNELGNYAINAFSSPGVLVNAVPFVTTGLKEKLKKFKIRQYIFPLTYYRFAGGSSHCLTNEVC